MPEAPFIEVSVGNRARVRRTLGAPCRILVGSSSACDLRVLATGVRARHLLVDWDGERLVVRSPDGTSSVSTADGPLALPCALAGRTVLGMGHATVLVTVPEGAEDESTLVRPEQDETLVSLPAVAGDVADWCGLPGLLVRALRAARTAVCG